MTYKTDILRVIFAVMIVVVSGCDNRALSVPVPERIDGGMDVLDARSATDTCDGFRVPGPASVVSYTADVESGSVYDNLSGLTWQSVVDATAYTQSAGASHCMSMGNGWRLPTRLELVSLIDVTVLYPGPTINKKYFAGALGGAFWTSSDYVNISGDSWYVDFSHGSTFFAARSNEYLVRCVRRASPTYCYDRYQIHSDGTVLDGASGLIWQQLVDGESYSWGAAMARCSDFGSGWRLPNLIELQTIVDDSSSGPAIDENVFPGTVNTWFWTGSDDVNTPGNKWVVNFADGITGSYGNSFNTKVRCVR